MKNLTLLTVLMISFQVSVFSQCLSGGIIFTQQSQIDNFQSDYPNCTEIEGYVKIDGDGVNNLDSLISVVSIGGYLEIRSSYNLSDFSGLDSLENIGGDFLLWYNHIWEFSGLGNLMFIGGDLILKTCYSLENFEGLESLSSIGGGLRIGSWEGGNPYMTSFDGLENLTSIGGELEIRSNNNLINLDGIINIDGTTIQNLMIYDNESLSTCHVESICEYLGSADFLLGNPQAK